MQIHNTFCLSCYICRRKVLCLVLANKKYIYNTINLGWIFVQLLKLHEDFMQQRYICPRLLVPKSFSIEQMIDHEVGA